jgi:hypothetical protein
VCSLEDDPGAGTDSGSDSGDQAPRKRRHRLESVTFFNGKKGSQKRISCVVDGECINFFVNCMPAVCFSAIFQASSREVGHRSLMKRAAVLVQVRCHCQPAVGACGCSRPLLLPRHLRRWCLALSIPPPPPPRNCFPVILPFSRFGAKSTWQRCSPWRATVSCAQWQRSFPGTP